jgi:hypothetical protein
MSSVRKKERKVIIQVQPDLFSGEPLNFVQKSEAEPFHLTVPTAQIVTPPPSSKVRSDNSKVSNNHGIYERHLINIYKPESKKTDPHLLTGNKKFYKVSKEGAGEIPNSDKPSHKQTTPELLLDGYEVNMESFPQLRPPLKSNKHLEKEVYDQPKQQQIRNGETSTDEDFAFEESDFPVDLVKRNGKMEKDDIDVLIQGPSMQSTSINHDQQEKILRHKINEQHAEENKGRQKELNDELDNWEKLSSVAHHRKQKNSQLGQSNSNRESKPQSEQQSPIPPMINTEKNDNQPDDFLEQSLKEKASQQDQLIKASKNDHFGDQLEQLRKELLTQLPMLQQLPLSDSSFRNSRISSLSR